MSENRRKRGKQFYTEEDFNLHVIKYLVDNSSFNHRLSLGEIALGLYLESAELFAMDGDSSDSPLSVIKEDISNAENDIAMIQLFKGVQFQNLKTRLSNYFDRIFGSGRRYETALGIILHRQLEGGSKASAKQDDKIYYAESLLNEMQISLLRDALMIFPYAEKKGDRRYHKAPQRADA